MSAFSKLNRNAVRNNPSSAMIEPLEVRRHLSAVPLAGKIQVAMATDAQGNPLNQSRVTVRFSENINLVDTAKFRLFGYSINTATGSGTAQQKTTIGITSVVAGADGNKLVITTDRRVRKGARLTSFDGAVTNQSDSTNIGEQSVLLPKGLNKERFTLACRAFVPTQYKFFEPDLFPQADPLVATPTGASLNTVTNQLTAYLDKEVASGFITAEKKTQALAVFNNTNIKAIVPAANIRAALASLVGTVAESAIDQFTTSANVTGKPFTVIDFSTEVSNAAVITETKGNTTTGRLRTLFKTTYVGENFLTIAPFLAHEGLRQDVVAASEDLPDGINESEVAVTFETIVWAQELLIDSAQAGVHTTLSTHLNVNLLAMLNSGTALFPRVGLFDAPILGGNALPTSTVSGGAYTSFENFIRRTYTARGFADVETKGNPYTRVVTNNITARTDDSDDFKFTDNRVEFFDKGQQIITDKAAIKLAAVLKLKITK